MHEIKEDEEFLAGLEQHMKEPNNLFDESVGLKDEKQPLHGLERVCKLVGAIKCGNVCMVWDYASEKAVQESEMLPGSERWQKSERARWQRLQS